MIIRLDVVLDTDTDTLLFRVPAADGEGDVTVLALDLKTLSADDKRRLRHVRTPTQAQRPPGSGSATRGPA